MLLVKWSENLLRKLERRKTTTSQIIRIQIRSRPTTSTRKWKINRRSNQKIRIENRRINVRFVNQNLVRRCQHVKSSRVCHDPINGQSLRNTSYAPDVLVGIRSIDVARNKVVKQMAVQRNITHFYTTMTNRLKVRKTKA